MDDVVAPVFHFMLLVPHSKPLILGVKVTEFPLQIFKVV